MSKTELKQEYFQRKHFQRKKTSLLEKTMSQTWLKQEYFQEQKAFKDKR